jgi:hypothetical protein
VKTARKHRGVDAAAAKRSRDDERKMDKLIDELCGCLTEGDALAELEREHRGEVLAEASEGWRRFLRDLEDDCNTTPRERRIFHL